VGTPTSRDACRDSRHRLSSRAKLDGVYPDPPRSPEATAQSTPRLSRKFHLLARLLGIVSVALLGIAAHPAPRQSAPTPKQRYLSPLEMAITPDGRLLYVVCQDSDEVRVVEAASGKLIKAIPVGHVPRAIALSADAKALFITNAWSDTVSVIDTTTLAVVRTLPTGFEPSGVIFDSRANFLYVANRLSNDISVIDFKTGQETKRLLAGRGASYLSLSPDGKFIYCTHVYPNPGAFRSQPQSEITVIDTGTQTVVERKPLHNVAGAFHLTTSADGKLSVVAQLRPKNLIPLAHVQHG